jgi:hypothetical protein
MLPVPRPVGAVLKDACWAVPTAYTTGDRFDTHGDALSAAIAAKRDAVRRHEEHYAGQTLVPLPERITVDLRWSMRWPHVPENPTRGVDTVAARFEYESIAAAEAALDLLVRVAGTLNGCEDSRRPM